MNITGRYCLIIFLVTIHCLASAQLPDGVRATQSFLDTIRVNYTYENSYSFNPDSPDVAVKIPLMIYIIMNKDGVAGVDKKDIAFSISLANSYFKTTGIQFFTDTIEYINDYNYSFITYNDLRVELLTKYSAANRINVFLADSVEMGSEKSYGFTYFPDMADSNFIYLDKKFANGNSLATMLGHFMGLLSTHEVAGGRELASERNCDSSGDFICDTYADPDLFNQVIDSCKYIGTMRDDNGNYFIPSVANLMSNAPDHCRCVLTPMQYRRILYYYHKYREYLNSGSFK